jgi:hypothetical protein
VLPTWCVRCRVLAACAVFVCGWATVCGALYVTTTWALACPRHLAQPCTRMIIHPPLAYSITHSLTHSTHKQINRDETMQWFVKKFEGILNTGKPVNQSNYRARKGKKK